MGPNRPRIRDAVVAFGRIPTKQRTAPFRGVFIAGESENTHIQGIVRIDAGYLLTHSDFERDWGRLVRIRQGEAFVETDLTVQRPAERGYYHPGGVQLVGDCLVVPIEHRHLKSSKIVLYDVSGGGVRNLFELERPDGTSAAGGSTFSVGGVEYVVLCAYGGSTDGVGVVDFYRSPSARFPELRHWFRATVDERHHQAFQLFASGADGERLFAIGLNKSFIGSDEAVLYEVQNVASPNPALIPVLKRRFRWYPNDGLRYGASIEVSETGDDFVLVSTGHRFYEQGGRSTAYVSTRQRGVTDQGATRADAEHRHLIVFGDSVLWGQGLQERNKCASLVAERLAIDRVVVSARSGAVIGAGGDLRYRDIEARDSARSSCGSDVPQRAPTILDQVATSTVDARDAAVVLVDGGINDVGLIRILNPFTTDDELKAEVDRHCFEDMRLLLQHVLHRFDSSDTQVVLTGYFPIFSRDSEKSMVSRFVEAMGASPHARSMTRSQRLAVADRVIHLAQLFWRESSNRLKDAVDSLRTDRLMFAGVPFRDENAMFASDAWLFGLGWTGRRLVPEDEVPAERLKQCRACYSGETFSRLKVARCSIASAGHPNLIGARQYASAVLNLLEPYRP